METWEQTGMKEHGVFRELLIWDNSSWGAKWGRSKGVTGADINYIEVILIKEARDREN